MEQVLSVANWLLPLIYLTLAIDYGATFLLRTRTHDRNLGAALAGLCHLLFMVGLGLHIGSVPLARTGQLLSMIALASVIVYWVTELLCKDRRAGALVFLVIFLFQYTASSFINIDIHEVACTGQATEQGLGRLHFLPATFAYTAFFLAAAYAMLFLIGQRNLKQHHFGLLFDRLPPLELLGKMSWYTLLAGFVLMTATMITGALFLGGSGHGPRGISDPKILAKIIIGTVAWTTCATAMVGKWLGRWSARGVSRIAVAGFVIVVILFITSALLS